AHGRNAVSGLDRIGLRLLDLFGVLVMERLQQPRAGAHLLFAGLALLVRARRWSYMLVVQIRNAVLDGALLCICWCWTEAEHGEPCTLRPGAACIERPLRTGHADWLEITETVGDSLPHLFVPRRVLVTNVVAVEVPVLEDFLERFEHELRPQHLPGAGEDVSAM